MVEGEELETKRCKGVKDSAIEELTLNDYLNCVFKGEEKTVKFNLIHSTGHDIYTEKMEKIALTPTQDVRYVLPDHKHTLSIGYEGTKEKEHIRAFELENERKN